MIEVKNKDEVKKNGKGLVNIDGYDIEVWENGIRTFASDNLDMALGYFGSSIVAQLLARQALKNRSGSKSEQHHPGSHAGQDLPGLENEGR